MKESTIYTLISVELFCNILGYETAAAIIALVLISVLFENIYSGLKSK